jgi:hypothetical protein
LLAATQHRVGGDERDKVTDSFQWRARRRSGIAGRGEVKEKTESDNTEGRGSEGRKQASTKRLFLFSPPLPAV